MVEPVEWVKKNWVFSLVMAAFLSTQVFLVASIWHKPLFWDSSIYIATGKYIYSFGQYGFWSSLRGPGVPMVIGLFWKLGLPMVGFPRLVWMSVSILGLGVFYTLADRMFGRTEAIATAGIIASSHAYYFFTPEVLTGIPSSILVFSSLYMVTRERYFAGGVLAASAFLFRYPAALVGPAAVMFILARGFQRGDIRDSIIDVSKFSAAVVALVAPYMVFLHIFEGSMFAPFLESAANTASAGTDYTAIAYYFIEAVKSNPLNLLLPVGLYTVFRDRDWRYGGFFASLVLFYVFFGLFPLKIERYILPFLPLIALFSARGVKEIAGRVDWKDIKLEWVIAAIILAVMSYSFATTYSSFNWQNPDRKQFLGGLSSLEGEIATNDPATNLYNDFRYHPLPPAELSEVMEEDGGSIDHWAINSCYWDCRGDESCLQNVEEFEDQLDQRYEKSFELKGNTCNYVVYSR